MQEIERKYLVSADDSFREMVASSSFIAQGYMDVNGATVRIRLRTPIEKGARIADGTEGTDGKAYLTIKGPSCDGGLSRYEFEREVPLADAKEMLKLCRGGVVTKVRHLVPYGGHTFEVDEFYGDNEGLLFAEVELHSPDEQVDRPQWLAQEVTGDARYYNKNLLRHPYKEWK